MDEKNYIMIDQDRYDELIKKEALYDEIMKDKEISIYLYSRLEEVKKLD